MPPKIVVLIDDQGELQADFIAFSGRSCEEVEARLRRELAAFGVVVEGGAVSPKSESRIAQEIHHDQRNTAPCRKVNI